MQQAQQEVSNAEAELEAFYQRQGSGTEVSEQDLIDAVEQAQEVYDDAVAALESTKTTYGRAVSSANLPAGTSNSAQIVQITYDQMKLELEKLQALKEAEGMILSPTDGIVTKCNVQTGEKTTDTTAILLADLSQGCPLLLQDLRTYSPGSNLPAKRQWYRWFSRRSAHCIW